MSVRNRDTDRIRRDQADLAESRADRDRSDGFAADRAANAVLSVRFGRQAVLRDITSDHPARPDAGGDWRKRLRQDGAAQDLIGLVPPTQGAVLFDGQDLSQLERARN